MGAGLGSARVSYNTRSAPPTSTVPSPMKYISLPMSPCLTITSPAQQIKVAVPKRSEHGSRQALDMWCRQERAGCHGHASTHKQATAHLVSSTLA